MIQVCGAELARAMKRVCEDGDLDFFNLQHVQHHHQHGHDHQHDHQHDHHLDHQHSHHNHEWKGKAVKRDTSVSLADLCCAKPCHIMSRRRLCDRDIEGFLNIPSGSEDERDFSDAESEDDIEKFQSTQTFLSEPLSDVESSLSPQRHQCSSPVNEVIENCQPEISDP
ncbi:hypothetical protein PYW08_004900 [Mythimna loreyi]|uniref:Uncharacterized protein n=1 Tax=Mythimna loreyi TaxID=667449 RepID=A0ACC2QG17_9NEOP|nr:hypothetical protein PYW08_004900 [Mythimna loreyi]